MHTFSFEKLEVWKNTKSLTINIYKNVSKFPTSEKYGLVSQMQRAAVSVASNIAEGTSSKTKADKAHFTTIAYSSLMELLNQAIIANELGYIDNENYLKLREMITYIADQLNSLHKYQLNC